MLNFTISKPLYSQVEDYDVRKPAVEKKSKTPRNTFPKAGIPENLVPANILPKQQLLNLIQTANRDTDSYYNHIVNVGAKFKENAVIVAKYGNRFWYAIWFDSSQDVIFNYTLCVRNLKTIKNYKYNHYFTHFNVKEEDFSMQTHSRKEYLYLTRSVTLDDLKNHTYQLNSPFAYFHNITDCLREIKREFVNKLKAHIKIDPTSQDMFWYYNRSLAVVLGNYRQQHNFHWVPDLDYYLEVVNSSVKVDNFKEILNTPFFKKSINQDILSIIEGYNKVDLDSASVRDVEKNITSKNLSLVNKINVLKILISIYGEQMTLDYLQQIWLMENDFHVSPIFHGYTRLADAGINWFSKNVPVKSFVNMFINSPIEIKDTIDMVSRVINRKPDIQLEYSGRWRVNEFHDWIMAEEWKLVNKNVKLPQDLFPTPLKVGEITYIQPFDTHQLSKWGKSARNCVGSSTYSDGVLKKNHFIILGLKNNAPHLTIQARVEDENFKIVQIKKQCNSSLNSEEEAEFSNTFKTALEIRTNELANTN